MVLGQCLAVKASWLSPLGRRTRGYWGWLRDLDRFGRGVEHMFGFFSHWASAVLDGWRRRNKNLIRYAAAIGLNLGIGLAKNTKLLIGRMWYLTTQIPLMLWRL